MPTVPARAQLCQGHGQGVTCGEAKGKINPSEGLPCCDNNSNNNNNSSLAVTITQAGKPYTQLSTTSYDTP
jgi:hypothetical protein